MELIAPGRVLAGRYRLVEPLASGGMATVWIADDRVLSRPVAVKILRADLAADDATRTRFRNEAIAAAGLSHPNIVSTFDTGDDDGAAFIVMELVTGPTVRQLVDEHGPLPVRDVIRIGRDVAAALDAAHRVGLVHRDVKPANVLVPETGPAKVTDFGIAKAAGAAELTRTGMVMGTARYLSPEQVHGRAADERSDVYALGLLLWEMCCGHPPFGGETEIATAMARLTTVPPAVRAERPDVPRVLDDLVHRCLARDPARRFASASAVRRALDLVGTSDSPAPSAPRATPPSPRPAPAPAPTRQPVPAAAVEVARRRGSWWWLAVVVVAVAAGVAAFFVARSVSDGGGSDGGGFDGSASSTPAATEATLSATDFDPFDSDPAKQESPELVGNTVDGDPDTAWPTERYVNFAEKPGVGVRVDLDGTYVVRAVEVAANRPGWSAEIYVSTDPGETLTTLSDWGEPVASGTDRPASARLSADPSATARSVLVWFTALPAGDDGLQSLAVSEISLA